MIGSVLPVFPSKPTVAGFCAFCLRKGKSAPVTNKMTSAVRIFRSIPYLLKPSNPPGWLELRTFCQCFPEPNMPSLLPFLCRLVRFIRISTGTCAQISSVILAFPCPYPCRSTSCFSAGLFATFAASSTNFRHRPTRVDHARTCRLPP